MVCECLVWGLAALSFGQEAMLWSAAPEGFRGEAPPVCGGGHAQRSGWDTETAAGRKAHLAWTLVHALKMSRSYKAKKVIFLKRKDDSSRCGLEEAVVTGLPGQKGPSGNLGG